MSEIIKSSPPKKGPGARAFLQSEMDYLANAHKTHTIAEMARSLGRGFSSVQGKLQSMGLYAQRASIKRQSLTAWSKLSRDETSYLAGIVDGEGTVSVARRYNTKKDKTYYQPLLTINNTNLDLSAWLEARGFKISYQVSTKRVPCWKQCSGGLYVGSVLERLRPFLVIKAPQADLVMQYCQLRMSQSLREKPTHKMLQIYADLRRLNMRIPLPAECQ